MFYGAQVKEENVKKVHNTVQTIEEFLTRNKWIAGPSMTIADISFASILAGLPMVASLFFQPYFNSFNSKGFM